MPGTLTDTPAGTFVPSFRLSGDTGRDWRHFGGVAAASVIVHIFLGMGAVAVLRVPPPRFAAAELDLAHPRQATKLVAPPSTLTQKTPNRGELSKEFNLASLPPRPAQRNVPASPGAAAAPKQKFNLPQQKAGAPSSALPEAPNLDLKANAAPPPPLGMQVQVPPPQIQAQEKPKLTFEKPGVTNGTAGPVGVGRVPVPKPSSSVDDAVRQMSRGGGRGMIVGDEDAGSIGSSPSAPNVPIPGKLGSSVELLSDPQGVDFWPYLMRVLSAVRRNWFAVIPESARLGRQGRTLIQFAINRDGTVPKLVISTPSGTDALDRAAVASISASNPFPPLPSDFKGGQIRLQFAFKYNVR